MTANHYLLILYHSAFHLQASPKGQLAFDRLLKACGEAVWKGETIIVGTVGHQVVVDPPYTAENCKLLKSGSGKGTLDRVQKVLTSIVS